MGVWISLNLLPNDGTQLRFIDRIIVIGLLYAPSDEYVGAMYCSSRLFRKNNPRKRRRGRMCCWGAWVR